MKNILEKFQIALNKLGVEGTISENSEGREEHGRIKSVFLKNT